MAEVDILLAAYNGEKFIAKQIDSIMAQTFKNFRILIRDDGSTDGTLKIIESYASKYPEIIKIIYDNEICKNPTKNFFQLMKHATANYVMFADQDDFWLPCKIQYMLDVMKDTEQKNPDKPVLIFSEWKCVDENLASTDKTFVLASEEKQYENFTILLTYNCVAGCTSIINKAVYKNIGAYDEIMPFHDYWLALFACGCGVIKHIQKPLILHRLHENNCTGRDEVHTLRDIISTPIKKFISSKNTFDTLKNRYLLLKSRYFQYMMPDKIKELENYLLLFNGNIYERLKTFININHVVNFSLKEKTLWLIRIFLF